MVSRSEYAAQFSETFDEVLDEEYGSIEICGEEFSASHIFAELAREKYMLLLEDFVDGYDEELGEKEDREEDEDEE